MKHTKIAIAIATALMLMVGCQTAPASSEASAPATTTPDPAIESYTEVLKGISSFEQGEAGTSLKIFVLAANVLNFAEEYDISKVDALTAVTTDYLKTMSAEQKQIFASNLEYCDVSAQEIIQLTPEAKGMLEDSGAEKKYESYNAEKYQAIKKVISDALAAK